MKLEKSMNESRLPWLAVVAASAQTLVALTCLFVWGAWACWGVFPYSLILSSVLSGPFLVVSTVSAWGLWKRKQYGWFAGVGGDGVICAMLFFIVHPMYFCALPLLPIALLLPNKVREFYSPTYPDSGLSINR